jgi:hypothetical protein
MFVLGAGAAIWQRQLFLLEAGCNSHTPGTIVCLLETDERAKETQAGHSFCKHPLLTARDETLSEQHLTDDIIFFVCEKDDWLGL